MRYFVYLSRGQPAPDPPAASLREDARRPGGPDGIIRAFRSRRLRDEYVAQGVHETRHPGGTWYRAACAIQQEEAMVFLGDCGQDTVEDNCSERNCRRHLRPGRSIRLGPAEPWTEDNWTEDA